MGVLGRHAAARLGQPLRDIALAELYSCFPVAVRVQQRELDLNPAGTPTLTGGMAFAGGPFNHYVLLSTVTMGHRLRAVPGELGLVTTVSGMLSKPGLAVWGAAPPADRRAAGGPGQRSGRRDGDPARSPRPRRPTRPGPPWCPSPSPSAAQTGSNRSARSSWPTCPMGSAPLPPAKMHPPPVLALAEGLVGRTVELKDTRFRI